MPVSRQRHSGFAQFSDMGKRDEFIRAVFQDDAELTHRAHVSGSRPTIVFENLTDQEKQRVVSALGGLGRWFEDIRFETMG